MVFPLEPKESDAIQARINAQEELIVAAAIKTVEGAVIFFPIPGRHGESINFCSKYGIKPADGRHYECGFITNHGRFVDRVEAGEIVLASKQGTYSTHPNNPTKSLFSEDMWLCELTDPRSYVARAKCDCSDDTGLCPTCFP